MVISEPSPPRPAAGERPRIWLLLSDKLGDNAQVLALADALGLDYEIRRLVMKPRYVLGKPLFRTSIAHLDRARSDPLEPPWPDLILTIGRRCTMAALWVRRRARGRCRIVLVGRPRQRLGAYDLLIVPPQYALPESDRVIPLDLPLLEIDRARLEAAREAWRDRLGGLARPLTAVLVGGATRPYRFDAEAAEAMVAALERYRMREGGTLYLSTSRRTGAAACAVLERAAAGRFRFYRFDPEDREGNPYLGLLAWADRFVVTGDSISMIVEVARLGRPLAIYPLPLRRDPRERLVRAAASMLAPGGRLGALGRVLRRAGLLGVPRDLDAFHRRLYDLGLAVPFGAPFRPTRSEALGARDDLAAIAARIRALLEPLHEPDVRAA